MANFFNNVIAPQLNSTEYGLGIQDMVNTINDNFQKVFTLPFLQGDDGDMISTEFCLFWEKVYNSNDEIEVDKCLLTQEGAKIYNTIFETDKFSYSEDNRMTYNDFKKVLIDDLKLYSNNNSYNDISLFTNLYGPHKDPKILLFYKISSEDGVSETPLGSAQLYYYFDPRINELSELITINNEDTDAKNYRQDFRDYTCILSTKYDSNGNYTYEKQSGWPTLYFDNSSKQYCWSINGQQTGVNAQGVNGKDGIGARIWVCLVKLDEKNSSQENYETGTMSRFIIEKVFVPKDSGWRVPGDELKSYLGETNYFQQGDMAVCYLPNSEKNSENKYSDQMIGVINQNSNDNTFFVQASISQNTTNTFKNLSLFNLLSSIGTGENDTPTMKGIFIPTTVGNNTSAHTLYEGDFNGQNPGLYLVKTDDYNNIKFNGGSIELLNNGDTFNVYYNTNIYGETVLEGALNTYNVIFNTTTGTDNNGKDWYVGGYLDFYGNKNTTGGKTSYKRSLRLFEKEGELFAINNGGVNPSSDGYGSATINTGVLKSRLVVVGSSDSLNSSGLSVTGTTILNSGAEIYNGLTVNDATTLNGTLTVDGITSLTGGLTANKIISLTDNLDNYKTAGFYRCSNSEISSRISNSPTKNEFALNIYETVGNGGGTNDNGVVLEIIEFNVDVNTDATANTFKRHLYNDQWGEWYRIPKSMSLSDAVGSNTQPIYMDSNGLLKPAPNVVPIGTIVKCPLSNCPDGWFKLDNDKLSNSLKFVKTPTKQYIGEGYIKNKIKYKTLIYKKNTTVDNDLYLGIGEYCYSVSLLGTKYIDVLVYTSGSNFDNGESNELKSGLEKIWIIDNDEIVELFLNLLIDEKLDDKLFNYLFNYRSSMGVLSSNLNYNDYLIQRLKINSDGNNTTITTESDETNIIKYK